MQLSRWNTWAHCMLDQCGQLKRLKIKTLTLGLNRHMHLISVQSDIKALQCLTLRQGTSQARRRHDVDDFSCNPTFAQSTQMIHCTKPKKLKAHHNAKVYTQLRSKRGHLTASCNAWMGSCVIKAEHIRDVLCLYRHVCATTEKGARHQTKNRDVA
jgi:hypothetical protein